LDAQEFDAEKARKKKQRIIVIVVVVLTVLALAGGFAIGRKSMVVGKFFDALQKQDFNTAYGIWMHDPDWKHIPASIPSIRSMSSIAIGGPGGEWGTIKTQKVYGSASCPGGGSGIVVDVVVNDRAEHAQVWVEKSDKTLSFPPCDLVFR